MGFRSWLITAVAAFKTNWRSALGWDCRVSRRCCGPSLIRHHKMVILCNACTFITVQEQKKRKESFVLCCFLSVELACSAVCMGEEWRQGLLDLLASCQVALERCDKCQNIDSVQFAATGNYKQFVMLCRIVRGLTYSSPRAKVTPSQGPGGWGGRWNKKKTGQAKGGFRTWIKCYSWKKRWTKKYWDPLSRD